MKGGGDRRVGVHSHVHTHTHIPPSHTGLRIQSNTFQSGGMEKNSVLALPSSRFSLTTLRASLVRQVIPSIVCTLHTYYTLHELGSVNSLTYVVSKL